MDNANHGWWTIQEVADYINISPEMVYKLVKNGHLPAIRIQSAWRVRASDLYRWIEFCQMEARPIILSESHHAIISDLTALLKKSYVARFRGLYIFGSTARGEADSESDIDLLVVLQAPVNRISESRRISDMVYELTFGKNRPVVASVLVAGTDDMIQRGDPLFSTIRKEGGIAA